MIFGVTGYLASGKDVLADFLIKKGFGHLSLSDFLREDLKKRGIPESRENLTKLGNDLRNEFGDDYLASRALKLMNNGNFVITSIGRVAEARKLKELKGFKLIFVTADQKIRYNRLKSRNRIGDVIDFNNFKKQEALESEGGNGLFREFDNLKKEADIVLENSTSLQDFEAKINNVLGETFK